MALVSMLLFGNMPWPVSMVTNKLWFNVEIIHLSSFKIAANILALINHTDKMNGDIECALHYNGFAVKCFITGRLFVLYS